MTGLIIVAIAIALVATLIAFGVLTRDKGVMTIAQWDPKRLPFTLIVEETLDGRRPQIREALRWAVSWWNKALDFEVFVPIGSVGLGDTIPVMTMDREGRALALTRHTTNDAGEILSAAVYVDLDLSAKVNRTELRRGLAHELGHLLGLAHDDVTDSVMYSKATGSEPILTEADRALLITMYKGGSYA